MPVKVESSPVLPGLSPVRGRAIVVDRRLGACLLCHTGPFPEEKFQGTLAPDLSCVLLIDDEVAVWRLATHLSLL